MAKYCPQCFTPNPPEAGKCSHCGTFLGNPYESSIAGSPRPRSESKGPGPPLLIPAILATLFCCQPFGIVAIVYAVIAASREQSGDYDGARLSADSAQMWCWISFAVGLVAWGIGLLFGISFHSHR